MGSRSIFKCRNCGDEIVVGGGINDGEDGKIDCAVCKKSFRLIQFLIPYDATSYTTGFGYGNSSAHDLDVGGETDMN